MIDDFCFEHESSWVAIGNKLIIEFKKAAQAKGATQMLVVCGAHDKPKRKFFESMNLICTSEWFTGAI